MNKQEQLDSIRTACIKANPEIGELPRATRLTDVLLAMETKAPEKHVPEGNGLIVFSDGSMSWDGKPGVGMWNLRQDDLTQQSDECVQFLFDLLK